MVGFVANTNILELLGVEDEVSKTFINNATVTVTVKDSDDVEVVGTTWPLSMAYVAASSGNYRVALPDTLVLLHKKTFRAFIEVDGGADRIGHWEFPFKPETRTGVTTT